MGNYYDSAEGVKIDRPRAIQELRRHGMTSAEDDRAFDLAVRPDSNGDYDAQAVLRWLGY